MNTVKLGIVGVGAMGTVYAKNVFEGKIPRCDLAAVCDPNAERLESFQSVDR